MADAPRLCPCPCHNSDRAASRIAREADQFHTMFYFAQEALRFQGVDTDDVVEAAVASGCSCINDHVPALQVKRIWGPRIIPKAETPPFVPDAGEGAE